MGKKKEAVSEDKAPVVDNAAAAPEDPAKPDAPPDSPIVVELKVLDDKYLEIEREYEREVQAIQLKYSEKQEPLLVQRAALLVTGLPDSEKPDEKASASGTPACVGFWLQSMLHLPALSDAVEEWDAPVLEYVTDVKKEYLVPTDFQKGFKISFHFKENPYFTNSVLWREYHTEESSPYTGEIDTTEIKASEIDWKDGKDVTVEIVQKKVKGGGQKKQKKKGGKEEPRDSFFRDFFKNLKKGMPLDDDIKPADMESDDEDMDDDEMVEMIMENAYEIGCSIRDQMIPFAVRWYTGEAAPDEDDDDEDDEEEDDDDDDDDDEESDSPSPAPKKKETKKKGGGGAAPGAGAAGDGKDGKAEECKQQ